MSIQSGGRFSIDNLRVRAFRALEITDEPALEPRFTHPRLISIQTPSDQTLFVSPQSRFSTARANRVVGLVHDSVTVFDSNESPPSIQFSAVDPHYDPIDQTIVYGSNQLFEERLFPTSGEPSLVMDLEIFSSFDFTDNSIDTLKTPLSYGDRFVFQALSSSAQDSFYLLEYVDNQVVTLLDPSTLLAIGETQSTIRRPDDIAIGPDALAIKTTLTDSPRTDRIYLKRGSAPFELLFTERQNLTLTGDLANPNDDSLNSGLGSLDAIYHMEFDENSNLLMTIRADAQQGVITVNSDGLIVTAELSSVFEKVSPLDTGETIGGTRFVKGETSYWNGQGAIYRQVANRYSLIIGPGHTLDGHTVSSVDLLQIDSADPDLIYVQANFDSLQHSRVYQLRAGTLRDEIPRIQEVFHRDETNEIYIALDRMTVGKRYTLWGGDSPSSLQALPLTLEVQPRQHVIMPLQEIGPKQFFRLVEEDGTE